MKRICKKCGVEKDIRSFTVKNDCVFGRTWTCKMCTKRQKSEYYRRNREDILKKQFNKRNNPDSRKAACDRQKEYMLNNPLTERQLKAKKLYAIKNKDKISKQRKEYRLKNAETLKEKQRENYRKNKDKYKELSKKYREDPKNKDKISKQRNRYKKRCVEELRDCYIKEIFRLTNNLKSRDIPQSLVDIHREIIKIKRYLKEKEL